MNQSTNPAARSGRTLVLGASPNPTRASFDAVQRLRAKGYEVIALGGREGHIEGVPIHTGTPELPDLDTITLYLGPARQPDLYDYILELRPRRLIFNPGTENRELAQLARDRGIKVEFACTLVMLAMDSY